MKISTFNEIYGHSLTIGELIKGFSENTKTGEVTSMNGLLNIRPPYQREFVYEDAKRNAVIYTVLDKCPLNVIYFAKLDDGKLEVIDGQQRITSICKFSKDQFAVNISNGADANDERKVTYSTLAAKLDEFNAYELMAFVCEGTNEEKMKWFRRINIAGVKLTEQELRNANFHGAWVTDAKKYFSRTDGAAMATEIGDRHFSDYTNAKTGDHSEDEKSVARQYLLEKVLEWKADEENVSRETLAKKTKVNVDDFMSRHYRELDAKPIWRYFEDVITWVNRTFPTYRKLMQSIEWGLLYNRYRDIDPTGLDEKVKQLLATEEVSNEKMVYEAVLSGDMKLLNARSFPEADRKKKYREQNGICVYCNGRFEFADMAGDHIVPWSKGGKTSYDNLQMLCVKCNCRKSAHDEALNPFDGEEYAYVPTEE